MDTGAEGGNMVFVKVRETYDLHTIRNKMTVIGIHTPKSDIIKQHYPGLLMQCRAYRPVSCDVKIACASMQSLDPLQVGTTENDIAPEDVFNPILYKAMSNLGMSQLEARINASTGAIDVMGSSANIETDTLTNQSDEFNLYYGLLANTHDWKHANPQAGLSMSGLRPLVYEALYNVGDVIGDNLNATVYSYPLPGGESSNANPVSIRGSAKPLPFMNTTSYSVGANYGSGFINSGFKVNSSDASQDVPNAEVNVPYTKVFVGCIIVPPSRLHELFYRMVIEWTLEFSSIRPMTEITDWGSIAKIGASTHYQNYDYSQTKKAVTGSDETVMESDSCMVSANVDVNKVM